MEFLTILMSSDYYNWYNKFMYMQFKKLLLSHPEIYHFFI